jgi:glycosyltransferase involved in cell wall biosynthesis
MPLISVITPASRGVKDLSHIIRDFRNQTLPKALWEHIIVYDGKVPTDVQALMDQHKNDYGLKFVSIEKDIGDMAKSPGTKPRNHGLNMATGDYVVFCDDDDRYKDVYLETLIMGMVENSIAVVQMSCQESRMYRNGNPRRIVLVPEVGLTEFPIICHVGTPCFIIPRKWALEDPWRHEPEHDFRFIKRIVEKHKPQIFMRYGMLVDVDSAVIGDIIDWVSIPPFYRGEII